MKNLKTRFIALFLTIVTAFSMLSAVAISASAADNKKTAAASASSESLTPGDYVDEDDIDEGDLEDEKAIYEEDDTGLDFDIDIKDSLGEVMYEMVYRVIDHIADSSWVGSVFSMGGLVVLKSVYDAIGLKKHEPSPDTEMILDAIDKLSDKVSENHDEAMKSLKKLNSNIDTKDFRKQVDSISSDYEHIIKALDASSVSSKKTDGVLSESQYKAYKDALSDRELSFGTLQKNYDNMGKFVTGKSYTNDHKAGYISYIDYIVDKIDDENSGHDFRRAVDLKSAAKSIKKEIRAINNICLLDCATIAQIAQMEYKIAEYEQKKDISEKDEQPKTKLEKRLKQLDNTTKSMRKFYVRAIKYINKLGEATVKIGSVEKTFPRFGDAWATACKASSDFTITLNQNIKANGNKGLNNAGLGRDYGFNDKGGLIICEGKKVNFDFNKYSIDCSAKAFTFFDVEKNTNLTLKNGTLKNPTRATNFDNNDKEITTNITIDKMTIAGCKDTALHFNCYNKSSLKLTDSTIKDTKSGCAIKSDWHLKYNISGTTFENNKGEYGGAMHGTYAADGSGVDRCTFIRNSADKTGGALYCVYNVTNSTFKNNAAKGGKGGAFAYWGSVTNCTFEGNTATDQGGAVWVQSNVTGCTFKNNMANGNGGALFVQSKNKTVDNCKFENNSTSSNGGALAFDLEGNCTKNCTFNNNKASGDGGGLFVPTDQNCTVESCNFESNKAGADGGGISVCAHTNLTLKNSKLTYNEASRNGGGVYLGALSFADHVFNNVTITDNNANGHGGGIYANTMTAAAADIKLYETVIIKNNHIGSTLNNYTYFNWLVQRVVTSKSWTGGKNENAYMVQAAGKKAMFYTKDEYKKGTSCIYITSSTNSDIAVVDLSWKDHEPTFHADNGRRIYRGSLHNYTLYLDTV